MVLDAVLYIALRKALDVIALRKRQNGIRCCAVYST